MNCFVRIYRRYRAEGVRGILKRFGYKIIGRKYSQNEFLIHSAYSEEVGVQACGKYNNPQLLTVKPRRNIGLHVPFANDFCFARDEGIAVFAHVFYPEMMGVLLQYFKNLPEGTDLFVSTDTSEKKAQIQKYLKEYSLGNVKIKITENRGRDIAPFICAFSEEIRRYKYVLHVHTKKSPHADKLNDWGKYCYDSLIGSKEIVRSILYLLSEKRMGMIAPRHYPQVFECVNWGFDFDKTKELVERMGGSLDCDSLLDFPSGSMFWARSQALEKILDLNLKPEEFDEERGQIDGTLAHAVERSFYYGVELSGFQWLKISSEDVGEEVLSFDPHNSEGTIEKIYRPLFNKYVFHPYAIHRKYPETQELNVYPIVANERPRINLLLPTLDKKHIFGGIATALRLFDELKIKYSEDFDFRILVTDSSLGPQEREYYADRFNENPTASVDAVSDQIVVLTNRQKDLLYVRKNDFFIATAWWTALIARRVIRRQNVFFKNDRSLIYLIQDYEPDFYSWSTKWALAEQSYYGKTIAIVNSGELYAYMKEDYNLTEALVLPYDLNETLASKRDAGTEKIKQIIFYGRPSVDRNCFELIVDGLCVWQHKNPMKSKEWRILSLGESYDEREFQTVKNLEVKGKVSLEEYAKILNESWVGISLMISPHPSYPPLEMASFGLKTITNKFNSKNLLKRSGNIINIQEFSPEAIACAIDEAISKRGKPEEIFDIEANLNIYNPTKLIELVKAELAN